MGRARSNTVDDFDRTKDALHKLKKAYSKVVKENKQLRKQLNQVSNIEFEKELEETLEIVPQEKPKVVDKVKCGKCKSENVIQIEAGAFMVFRCDDCGHKRSKKT